MVPGNFNWFLHTMLFYHTRYVIQKQERKRIYEENDVDIDVEMDVDADVEMDADIDVA
jgi:hypothetical protein